eukprot:12855413-Alexandrium_andersonii.AAC.1
MNPSLGERRVSAPFAIEGAQYVGLWGSFFRCFWAKDFARPDGPLVVVRPYRGVPRQGQPEPWARAGSSSPRRVRSGTSSSRLAASWTWPTAARPR